MDGESDATEELHGTEWEQWAREPNEATIRRLVLGVAWGTHLAGSSFGPERRGSGSEGMGGKWEEPSWDSGARMGKGDWQREPEKGGKGWGGKGWGEERWDQMGDYVNAMLHEGCTASNDTVVRFRELAQRAKASGKRLVAQCHFGHPNILVPLNLTAAENFSPFQFGPEAPASSLAAAPVAAQCQWTAAPRGESLALTRPLQLTVTPPSHRPAPPEPSDAQNTNHAAAPG